MRSTELELQRYDTDKIASGYVSRYDTLFAPWVDQPIRLLELGIHKGGSLAYWRDYFRKGTIIGIDLKLPEGFQPGERVQMFQGSQDDRAFLSEVAQRTAPDGFDIIIDDASHIGSLTKVAFWHLFERHLKPGGLYAIEDWGTGYWEDWIDGQRYRPPRDERETHPLWRRLVMGSPLRRLLPKRRFPSHDHGMVGVIKQLIDEQAAADVARGGGNPRSGLRRRSQFEYVLVLPSIVVIRKASESGTP